ncbi:MAG: hypothetical protein M3P45_00035 [Acidobacteriota bacterium]|nr:hypothetical protein [Acidobacteriota bacterium]
MRSTITPQPGLQSLYSTGSGGTTTGFAGFKFARSGLASTFAAGFFAARLGRVRFAAARARARLAAAALPVDLLDLDDRAVLVARITSALAGPLCLSCPDSPSETFAHF